MPPGQPSIPVQASCPSGCTKSWSHPITVFADLQHMHYTGSRMVTNLFDENGNFLFTSNRVDFFGYNFQQISLVDFTIQPGHRLNTHCVFDTTSRNSTVYFGISSWNEMCMDFLFYYPVLLTDAGNTYNFCGGINMGTSPNLSVCGDYDFNTSILQIPNPDVDDPISNYPIIFGTQNEKCPVV
jgi:hypothetical protein